LESGLTGSLELVVICDENVSWLKASMKGLDINEETLALDVIHEHALRGDFLGAEHTLRHVREGWQPRLVDRHNYEQWMASGGISMRERARVKIDEILGAEPQHILPPDVEERIRTITERAMAAQTK
jgi:trimethylamine--corrinoid protein Co-methyltransferase